MDNIHHSLLPLEALCWPMLSYRSLHLCPGPWSIPILAQFWFFSFHCHSSRPQIPFLIALGPLLLIYLSLCQREYCHPEQFSWFTIQHFHLYCFLLGNSRKGMDFWLWFHDYDSWSYWNPCPFNSRMASKMMSCVTLISYRTSLWLNFLI